MADPEGNDIAAYALPADPGQDGFLPDREGGTTYGDGLTWSNENVANQLWQMLSAQVDF